MSTDVMNKDDIITDFTKPLKAILTRWQRAGATIKNKIVIHEKEELTLSEEVHFKIRNAICSALEECPIPVEVGAVTLFGIDSCVELLKEHIKILQGLTRKSIDTIKQKTTTFLLSSEFKATMSQAADIMLEKASNLPWEEIYSNYSKPTMLLAQDDIITLKEIDSQFYSYIHFVLIGDAYLNEQKMNKLKSHHIGPVTRNSVGITWNTNPVPNPKTNSVGKKRKCQADAIQEPEPKSKK